MRQKQTLRTLQCLAYSFLVFGSLQASAFRSAIFPPALRSQTLLWVDQNAFFAAEQPTQKQRPIWVHAGDSISSGWASHTSLADLIESVKAGASLPVPGTLEFYRPLIPNPLKTWYAGDIPGLSLLENLQRITQKPWVLYSTALAGSELSSLDRNPLLLADSLPEAERARVQLLTLSLGSNDLCEGKNPFTANRRLESQTRRLLESFPNAQKVALATVNPITMKAALMSRLDEISDPSLRTRIKNYCEAAWQLNCGHAIPSSVSTVQPRIDAYLKNYLSTDLIQINEIIDGNDLLESIAADCFHPSKLMQPHIAQSLLKRIHLD